ncbi:MAG: DNA-processing protein DprA [Syntrophaceae bacterium]|nr:DNA-processing protein DprA [Deltaproteobacteria bacterium]
MSTIEAWIALDLLPAIGPRTVRKLLERFHSPERILSTPVSEIKESGILNKAQIEALRNGPDEQKVGEVLGALEAADAYALCLDDPAYPAVLRQIEDPPSVLYVKGSLDGFEPAVAIVGTRSPSHYGKETAFTLARDLSTHGISIVSGLARGIDREAHLGALDGIAVTVAVLGSGVDTIYPPEHADLSDAIAKKGAVVSEFPPGTKPDARNFPRRNRIISGLSAGVIVIEASLPSGAMITARFAGEQGRLVMAVPGAVTNVRSQGPHHLIRQGATLVQGAQDVIAEIAPQVKSLLSDTEPSLKQQDMIVSLVMGTPLSIEEIARELQVDIPEATRRVSMLELEGAIRRIEGNRFVVRSNNG